MAAAPLPSQQRRESLPIAGLWRIDTSLWMTSLSISCRSFNGNRLGTVVDYAKSIRVAQAGLQFCLSGGRLGSSVFWAPVSVDAIPKRGSHRVSVRIRNQKCRYFSMAPQAMRSPELPEGSDMRSSALAWITSDVPPSWKSELAPSPRVTPLARKVALALPFGLT